MQTNGKMNKTLTAVLYVLPVIFLIITYFCMTVTTEDMFQYAGVKSDYTFGFTQAFKYNSRLSDMYAWTIIRGFDYQFKFGFPDTLFRTVDVLSAVGIVLMITWVILGKRPRLRLPDGAVFCGVTLALFLNHWCESLYVAFSHIHNYLFICFFSMLLFLPFSLKILGREVPQGPLMCVFMLLCGFLFGFSSNVTPAAFLIVIFIAGLYLLFRKKLKPLSLLKLWELWAVIGILCACYVMYVVGRGYSAYTTGGYAEYTFYISIRDALRNPGLLISHILHNLYVILPCILVLTSALIFEIAAYKKELFNTGSRRPVWFSAICLLFVLAHCIAMSQIHMDTIIRLFMPAYLVTVMSVGFTAVRVLRLACLSMTARRLAAVLTAALMAAAVSDMAYSRISYSSAVHQILETVRTSPDEVVYVPRSAFDVKKTDIFGFYQDPMLTDWSSDHPVYGKHIELT